MGPTIFISVASYLDPMLMFTLKEAFSKAKYPTKIFVGVFDQNVVSQRKRMAELPLPSHIRYSHVTPQDTLGVSWARAIAFSLYDGEKFLLQIDSHTLFEKDWDEALLMQYYVLSNLSAKPILTTYPPPFTMQDGEPKYDPTIDPKAVLVLRPTPLAEIKEQSPVLPFHAKYLFSKDSVPGSHIAAGFIFTKGSFVNEVPYDPFLYFHGEEQSLSLRAYTRGWDIYHPLVVPLRHLYKSSGTAYDSHHWHGDVQKERDFSTTHLLERSRKRMSQLVKGDYSLGAYGLGDVRTLDQYAKFSGIDYSQRIIRDPFNGELK